MAMKFFTAYVLVARLAQPIHAACDAPKLQIEMPKCQMNLGNVRGDICSRYATYTKCVNDLIAPCSASVKSVYTKTMEAEKRIYSSQLAGCQSSESSSGESEKPSVSSGSISANTGESEKPSGSSGSISGNTNQDSSCSSTEIQKKSSSCTQELSATAGGNICDAWQTFERCLGSLASCGSDVTGQISTMMSSMKTGPVSECASSSASKSFSTAFAAVAILLGAAF